MLAFLGSTKPSGELASGEERASRRFSFRKRLERRRVRDLVLLPHGNLFLKPQTLIRDEKS